MYFVDTYRRAEDKAPIIVQAYKTKSGAEKCAEKRRANFPRVEIVKAADGERQFSHGLTLS